MHVSADSFYALCRDYRMSDKFKSLGQETQKLWGRELEFACRPNCLGHLSAFDVGPAETEEYLDGWSDKPGKQAAALTAFKQLEKWALKKKRIKIQFTLGVEIQKSDGGHIPWTDGHVELGEAKARPDLARVITLGAATGQRGSDLIRLMPSDIEVVRGIRGINVKQVKTGVELWIPITQALATAMESWEKRPGPFCRMLDGEPWPSRKPLTEAWNYERDHANPALQSLKDLGLVLHGLRGHKCVRLYNEGYNTKQIANLVGMSEQMVARYTKKSVQKENAVAAILHLDPFLKEQSRIRGPGSA